MNDSDRILKQLRELAALTESDLSDFVEMAAAFRELDRILTEGRALPSDWLPKRM